MDYGINQGTLDDIMLVAIEGSALEDFSYEEALERRSKKKNSVYSSSNINLNQNVFGQQ